MAKVRGYEPPARGKRESQKRYYERCDRTPVVIRTPDGGRITVGAVSAAVVLKSYPGSTVENCQ
jgi:hypothetical protein